MSAWFDALSGLEQTLFLIAIFSTTIFGLQLISTFAGLGGDEADMDAIADGGPMDFGDIFSIRNVIAFLMGFGWGGLMAFDWGLTHEAMVFVMGFLVGSFFLAINVGLLLAMSRLRNQGNIRLENAIDEPATVTLSIPGNRSGSGKVMVTIQGRIKEYHAITDGEPLRKNTTVTVLDLAGSQLVVGITAD